MMKQSDVEKLDQFLERIKNDIYPEASSDLHTEITKKMFYDIKSKYNLAKEGKVLDVGCGQSVALDLFRNEGFVPVGITLGEEDIEACRQKGFEVHQMDQSFLNFNDAEFDFIWCRHCLEHSIFPYFTLSELYRVLKKGGYLYIEVPAPDTSCQHQTNKNHYSVLGKSMWAELIMRSGFNILNIMDINFSVMAGPDLYWGFIQQKV